MKPLKSLTCLLIILLTISACARESYPVEEPTYTMPTPIIELGIPVVSETARTRI